MRTARFPCSVALARVLFAFGFSDQSGTNCACDGCSETFCVVLLLRSSCFVLSSGLKTELMLQFDQRNARSVETSESVMWIRISGIYNSILSCEVSYLPFSVGSTSECPCGVSCSCFFSYLSDMPSSVLNRKGQIIEELFVMVLRHVHRRRWVNLCYVCASWRDIVQKLLWQDVDYGFLKVLAETSMVPGMNRYIVCL